MINMLLGQPGGGKSYEAVAFQIIPALTNGRKVITNLALILDAFPPEQRALIEIRTKTLATRPEITPQQQAAMSRFGRGAPKWLATPFSHIEDYGDTWRHPDNGSGPLYVIDECHLSLPKIGTPIEVEEWFSLHRHEFADVLLISQGYGKVNAAIIDLIQVLYRVKKGTAFGFSTKYIRKVYDGIKGDCVNTGQRTYEKRYFQFYKSHTRSGVGKEQAANDITPIWKRWPFLAAPVCLIAAALLFTRNGIDPVSSMASKKTAQANTSKVANVQPRAGTSTAKPSQSVEVKHDDSKQIQTVETKEVKPAPFDAFALHVAGYLNNGKSGNYYLFAVSQNGQVVMTINQDEIKKSGYQVAHLSECVAKVSFEGHQDRFVICDSPRIGMSPGSNVPTPSVASKPSA
jgi:zona occludens toxin